MREKTRSKKSNNVERSSQRRICSFVDTQFNGHRHKELRVLIDLLLLRVEEVVVSKICALAKAKDVCPEMTYCPT